MAVLMYHLCLDVDLLLMFETVTCLTCQQYRASLSIYPSLSLSLVCARHPPHPQSLCGVAAHQATLHGVYNVEQQTKNCFE